MLAFCLSFLSFHSLPLSFLLCLPSSLCSASFTNNLYLFCQLFVSTHSAFHFEAQFLYSFPTSSMTSFLAPALELLAFRVRLSVSRLLTLSSVILLRKARDTTFDASFRCLTIPDIYRSRTIITLEIPQPVVGGRDERIARVETLSSSVHRVLRWPSSFCVS